MIQVKRVYEPVESSDGFRILVDRLWPRGVSKEKVKVDLWMKDIAPSNELRVWFHHDPERWPEFKKRYKEELQNNPALSELKKLITQEKTTTFVFSAKDTEHNNAVVLKNILQ